MNVINFYNKDRKEIMVLRNFSFDDIGEPRINFNSKKIMKKLTFLLIIIPMTLNACGQQNKMKLDDIKEIWVYDYFPARGYTTAGAYGEIIRLEKKNTPRLKLEQSDVDSLCRILRETSPGKLFHTKWGGNLIFAELVLKNGQKIMAFIGRYAISVDIIKKNYWIKEEEDKKWLDEFIDRVRKEDLNE